jgi:hypothetical protein
MNSMKHGEEIHDQRERRCAEDQVRRKGEVVEVVQHETIARDNVVWPKTMRRR